MTTTRAAEAPTPWFRMETSSEGTSADVYIFDSIGGWFGVDASMFVREMAALDVEHINLYVNSPGGDVFDGTAIMNALRRHKATVTAYVEGLAASAASYIIQAADEVVMARGSELMIHDAWGFALGNAADISEFAAVLDKLSQGIAEIYTERAGATADFWRDAMRAETWYNAEEAVEAGLADRAEGKESQTAQDVAASFDRSVFAHASRREAPSPARPSQPARSQRPLRLSNGAALPSLVHAARRAHTPGRQTPLDELDQLAPAASAHTRHVHAAFSASHKPPAEPVDNTIPNQEGVDTMSNTLIQGLRERLGVNADREIDEGGLLAALDEALNERAEPEPKFTPPEGTVLMEADQLEALKADAAAGREAREEQVRARREGIVQDAIEDGRVAPARRDHWLAQLNADEEGAVKVLDSLAKGTIPLEAAGYTGGVDEHSDEDATYASVFPKKEAN